MPELRVIEAVDSSGVKYSLSFFGDVKDVEKRAISVEKEDGETSVSYSITKFSDGKDVCVNLNKPDEKISKDKIHCAVINNTELSFLGNVNTIEQEAIYNASLLYDLLPEGEQKDLMREALSKLIKMSGYGILKSLK